MLKTGLWVECRDPQILKIFTNIYSGIVQNKNRVSNVMISNPRYMSKSAVTVLELYSSFSLVLLEIVFESQVNIREHVSRIRLPTLVLNLRGDITRNPVQGVRKRRVRPKR